MKNRYQHCLRVPNPSHGIGTRLSVFAVSIAGCRSSFATNYSAGLRSGPPSPWPATSSRPGPHWSIWLPHMRSVSFSS